jgi:hypothetical protein
MDPSHRDGEQPGQHFRGDRCVMVNGQWFVATREGIDVGPYTTRDAAEAVASRLASMLHGIDDAEISRQFIREFMLLPDA